MFPRLRPALAVCASVIALAACPMLAGTGAEAASTLRAAAPLPPIGAQVPCSTLAVGSQFQYNGKIYAVDFRGGIIQRVDVNPSDPFNSVRLRTIDFKVVGENWEIGKVTIERGEVDVAGESTLKITQASPPEYVERDVIPVVTVTIEEPGHEPVVLESKEPMVLTGTITQYPPKGEYLSLEKPLDLVEADHPDQTVATLLTFPGKRGGL